MIDFDIFILSYQQFKVILIYQKFQIAIKNTKYIEYCTFKKCKYENLKTMIILNRIIKIK